MTTMTAQTLTFDVRPQGTEINYTGNCNCIEPGNTVTLQKGNVQICVNVTNCNDPSSIEGTVVCFKNCPDNCVEGLTVNSPITFSNEYVYGCSC